MTEQIELHHSDFAGARELQVCNLEHRDAFAWDQARTRQLHGNLLGIRIQDNGPNLKRR